jgi:hypothetical protein
MIKSRRFYIWLLSFLAVFVVYLLYGQLNQTPEIKIGTGTDFDKSIAESNSGQLEGEMGKVGGVGVGTVQVARFMDYNKDKSVSREFGFEKLLHEDGSLWEIEKPYMNVFRPDLKCYFTADKGNVQVETGGVASRPTPKDAKLSGNVTMHVLPANKSSISESFIYLDDVSYVSEKSEFSTDGPIKLVNKDALMLGKGFELVYNDQQERIEYLKINDLDSLRLKSGSKVSLSPEQKETGTDTDSRIKTKSATSGAVEANAAPAKKREGQNYKVVLSKNVLIKTPEQIVSADEISLNNIFLSKGTGGEGNKDKRTAEGAEPDQNNVPIVSADMTEQGDAVITEEKRTDKLSTKFDTVVTCERGILFVPMDFPSVYGSSLGSDSKAELGSDKGLTDIDINDVKSRATFIAKKIEYDVPTGNTTAIGPSKITFYPKDMMSEKNQQTPVPVTITAQEKTEFLRASNQVNFEGDCQFTMIRQDGGTEQKYTLSSQKITVNLAAAKGKPSSDLTPGIEHLTAMGGVVQLSVVKQAGDKILGFTKLRCIQFDYDAQRQLFIASKGLIVIDNSKVAETGVDSSKFSLQKPCYAFLRDFDTMEYSLKTDKITANAEPNGVLLIDYIPIVDGKEGPSVKASAGNIEANLTKIAMGQSKLLKLNAIDGVTYEEENKNSAANKKNTVQFVGSQFIYDANESRIKAWGSDSQPCLFNNVLVDGLDYDLKSGRVKIGKIVGGSLQFQ